MTSVGGVLVSMLLATSSALAACSSGSSSTTSSSTAPHATTTTTRPQPEVLDCDLPPAGTQQIDISGTARAYDVYAPESISEPAPLLLLFHGYTSTSGEIARTTGLAQTAPQRGVVLVAPQGAGEPTDWNVIAGFDEDATFIDALIEHLRSFSCVEDTDLWLAGFSAGSAFSGVYGCSRAETVTGLGLVSGLPPAICPVNDTPQVIITHGTADPVVPFEGGEQPVGDTSVLLAPIPEAAAAWAERAGCNREPTERTIAGGVTVTTWDRCARGATVSLQVVPDGGHTWPGSADATGVGATGVGGTGVGATGVGATAQSFSASCVLLDAMTRAGEDSFGRCLDEGNQ